MSKIGYIRVSSVDQNEARQLDSMFECDKIFKDTSSGSSRNRPALMSCLDYIREDDCLVVHSIDRLARSLVDLQQIVSELNQRGVSISFVKEGLNFEKDSSDPISKLMFQMLGAVAEFERAMIRSRQREGIKKAKENGTHLGRKSNFTISEKKHFVKRWENEKISKRSLAKEIGITDTTLNRWIRQFAE